MMKNPNYCFCPGVDCPGFLCGGQGGATKKSTCGTCTKSFCFRCKAPWSRFHNCVTSTNLSVAIWSLARNIKRCPKCDIIIEKKGGCPHMTCMSCRHEFCWYCASDWDYNAFGCRGNKMYASFVCPVKGLVTSRWGWFGPDPITRTVTKTIVVGLGIAAVATGASLAAAALVTSPVTVPIAIAVKSLRDRMRRRRRGYFP